MYRSIISQTYLTDEEVLVTFPCLISCFALPTLTYRSNEQKFIQCFVGLCYTYSAFSITFFQITHKSSFVVVHYFAHVYFKK